MVKDKNIKGVTNQLPADSGGMAVCSKPAATLTYKPLSNLHPGVYIEEISGGARSVEAVGTSTAAFVGVAERGPTDEAKHVASFNEFLQIYGGYVRDNDIGTSYLAYAVDQFFLNGGRSCYVVRVEDRATNTDVRNENRLRDLIVGAGEKGIKLLDNIQDVNILVIPGWEKMSADVAITLINEGTAYCEQVRPSQKRSVRKLFFVADLPASISSPEAARDFVQQKVTRRAGGYTAMYYPWVTVKDPIGTGAPIVTVPPSGTIAGLYACIDRRRGVWKAPAGTEAVLTGVVRLADQVSDDKQDLLNRFGVNVIRKMPGAGIVSWGARTLATDPEWKYIPVRRLALMLEASIYAGIQWAVFEPNDERLRALLRLNINSFMMNLYRNGAFQGATPKDAFFVKCDGETTTQIDIDLGNVNILVGFAPLKPAEFVIVRISQKAGQKD